MEVINGHRAPNSQPTETALTLGNFDGVHLGHRALLGRAVKIAGEKNFRSMAMTFDPHPLAFLRPDSAPLRLTTMTRRAELISESGLSALLIEPFDQELAEMSAESFVSQILVTSIGVRDVIVGHDFRFGAKRSGDAELLRKLGKANGFDVHVVESVAKKNEVISSSKIRDMLSLGELKRANSLLGRPFDCQGGVVHGAKRGRTLGFPTANIKTERLCLPAAGIYAAWVENLSDAGRNVHMGAASLGTNPTFEDDLALSLEVYLLDFDADLYGQKLRIYFVDNIRSEEKFATVDSLVKQMHLDVQVARRILAAQPLQPFNRLTHF